MPIYQNVFIKEIGIDRRIHTPKEQQPIVPFSLDLLVQATRNDRQIRIPIEGANWRYRYAIPQPIDIPIVMFNRLLSRVC